MAMLAEILIGTAEQAAEKLRMARKAHLRV